METKETKNVWVGIIVIALIVGAYYFGTTSNNRKDTENIPDTNTSAFTKPDQNASKVDIASKSKCADDGKIFVNNFEQSMSAGAIDNKPLWFDPQFHFNSRLNTCLAYISFNTVILDSLKYDPSGLTSGNWNQTIENNNIVFDVYSNQAILQSDIDREYTYVNSQKSEKDTLSEYPYSQNIPNSSVNDFLNQLKTLTSE